MSYVALYTVLVIVLMMMMMMKMMVMRKVVSVYILYSTTPDYGHTCITARVRIATSYLGSDLSPCGHHIIVLVLAIHLILNYGRR